LASIWKELARRSSDKKKGINKITFTKYYVLPGIISERLFNVLDIDENGFLDPKEFINGMIILFTESFSNLVKFIFNFYDFNHDGVITREDVRIVLSYVPALQRNKLNLFESENDEISKIISRSFGDKDSLSQDEFVDVIENKCSDVLLFILLFILERRPFNNDTIKVFAAMAKNPTTSHISPALSNKIVVSPAFTSRFKSPALTKEKKTFQENSILKLLSVNNSENEKNLTPAHKKKKIVFAKKIFNRFWCISTGGFSFSDTYEQGGN
jgi:Ca2+-binding EF-hand superfamily protein